MKIALTGIKPSGLPHIGNYLGMIRPALALTARFRCLFFIADYHALTTLQGGRQDGEKLREHTAEVAATWLAFGLDPQSNLLYRQSDVPEVMELAWILACFTGKGQLDRAHAFKDASARKQEISAGVYTYPVLMAADILAFGADAVPVGKDQKQHLEICRDIAQRVNHAYGDLLVAPEALIQEDVETVPGLDGRKMSKSYDNTISLFLEPAALRKRVMRFQTDSTPVDAPKQPEGTAAFELYRQFAGAEKSAALAARLRAGGAGWAVAKEVLADCLEATLKEPRARYQELLRDRAGLARILADGAARARELAGPRLERVRRAIGVR